MFTHRYDKTDRPIHFHPEEARQLVVSCSRTGTKLPMALWFAARLFEELDTLAVRRLSANRMELCRAQESWDRGIEPDNGRWVEAGVDGDSAFWVSNAAMALTNLMQTYADDIISLISIYDEIAPETGDARAARAALEAAQLEPWPREPGTTPPMVYTHAAQWFSRLRDQDTDPAFRRLRECVKYLIDRPHTLERALDEQNRALDLEGV